MLYYYYYFYYYYKKWKFSILVAFINKFMKLLYNYYLIYNNKNKNKKLFYRKYSEKIIVI